MHPLHTPAIIHWLSKGNQNLISSSHVDNIRTRLTKADLPED